MNNTHWPAILLSVCALGLAGYALLFRQSAVIEVERRILVGGDGEPGSPEGSVTRELMRGAGRDGGLVVHDPESVASSTDPMPVDPPSRHVETIEESRARTNAVVALLTSAMLTDSSSRVARYRETEVEAALDTLRGRYAFELEALRCSDNFCDASVMLAPGTDEVSFVDDVSTSPVERGEMFAAHGLVDLGPDDPRPVRVFIASSGTRFPVERLAELTE